MLGQALVERKLFWWKCRRVVNQPTEEGAARICPRPAQPDVM
jgi:hypothetical protein